MARWVNAFAFFPPCLTPVLTLVQGVALGVADGVGGWVDSGIDPSIFSQSLMHYAYRYSRDSWAGEPETDPTQDQGDLNQVEGCELTPYQCLDLAYQSVLRDGQVKAGVSIKCLPSFIVSTPGPLAGSSTACLITLNSASGVLRAAK